MLRIHVEVKGEVQEVIQIVRHLGSIRTSDMLSMARADGNPLEADSLPETTTTPARLLNGRWTAALAADFAVRLEPASTGVVFHVWRAGESGIHRQALCERTGLAPAGIRSLLIQMWYTLQQFQRERGMTLSRPVLANSRRQRYLVDSDFAVVAASDMFGERSRVSCPMA